jgi:hypothetical protein
MREGLKNMATRIVQAETNFLDTLVELGGVDRASAERALAYFRKHRLVKTDAVNGRITVKHGDFLDPEAIRRAATL